MTGDLSLLDFFKQFPDEETAQKYFENQRWGDEIVCPYCGSKHISKTSVPMPYRCKDCRKHFSVRIGTVLSESKLPLQKWLLAIYILTNSKKGISSMQLAEYLDCTQKTAWFLAHRIRETWIQNKDKFSGIIEADETYIGGKEKNKHSDKKQNSGRGSVGKKAVFGMKNRNGNVKAIVVDSVDSELLTSQIENGVEKESTVYTDQFRSYNELCKTYNHEVVKHSVGEYVRNKIHTNGIESFWALLKRGYYGIYHFMSYKHLQKYVDEFFFRQNIKQMSTIEKMNLTIKNAAGKRLRYLELVNG